MKFNSPLIKATFIKRYKRFFADFELNGEIITAHTANTGTMKTCLFENAPSLLSFHDSPTRKLKYSFEMINNGKSWIGINTSLTNSLAIEAIKNKTIVELSNYEKITPEYKINKQSRIDILLQQTDLPDCYVEVKNVTLVNESNACLFPDAVTERGQKHLKELMELKSHGHRAVMLFIVQREDCDYFLRTNDIDPEYGKLLLEADSKGVEILVYQCELTPDEIKVIRKLPLK